MSTENRFPKGLFFKEKNANAPEWVLGKISIKKQELIEWLQNEQGDWVNLDVNISKDGKPFVKVDDWKPKNDNPFNP
jgi:hypothetical protein